MVQTGKELVKPIDNAFGHAIDYDSPDYKMREVLKQNVWDFSVAKNYNDNIALNNLLLDDGGKLRSWSDFKYEAQKVVGRSNRYLKTEYNTVVAGAQMSRLWQDIQRDKAIFPYAAFDVVDDGRTSDICEPLKGVVVSVDDPFLAHYFPPNHFNCRTTVRKLRNGTVQYPKEPLEIPESFQNNVGQTGKIFTEENDYISHTPKKLLKEAKEIARRFKRFQKLEEDKNYVDVAFNDNAGLKATHIGHNFDKITGKYEKEVRDILYEKGDKIVLTQEDSSISGKKVDGIYNDLGTIEISTVLGVGKNAIKRALNHARSKNANVAILYFPNKRTFDLKRLYNGIHRYNGQTDYRFSEIIYIVENQITHIK